VFYVDNTGSHGLEAQKTYLYGGSFSWAGAKIELANYPGWRLPTKDELSLIQSQSELLGRRTIWSSTEVDSDRVWGLVYGYDNNDGQVVPISKTQFTNWVRAIRDF
jgi:hypothetical protein